ncbi:symmetrical bis(5'-nucleosyl)-tetraphosphatase [Saezia sanguinis]|uniref:symmetrical bis(5'-nucleosyl)-tetraphosphatase n=1 Tax=Saezia sanguinis TaxID=1965230 RepID=UPI003024C481
MALYLIGDLQGCYQPFQQLLKLIDFSPSRDHLILLGDIVNRGPQSLETLEAVVQLGNAVTSLIGNHDTHLMGVAYGVRKVRRHDTLTPLLKSPYLWYYIDWLRHQHMALYQHGWLMVHAGVVPQWDLPQTLAYAHEVEAVLRSSDIKAFMQELFGNEPDRWSDTLTGIDRLRFIVNALTRIRFCKADGTLNFTIKGQATSPVPDLMPWFEVPGRKTENTPIAFGHWSVLGLINRPNLLALDTGCLWGGQLSAARIDTAGTAPAVTDTDTCAPVTISQVMCSQSVDPFSVK